SPGRHHSHESNVVVCGNFSRARLYSPGDVHSRTGASVGPREDFLESTRAGNRHVTDPVEPRARNCTTRDNAAKGRRTGDSASRSNKAIATTLSSSVKDPGFLLLEDGTLFRGEIARSGENGDSTPAVAEVVFTTNMTGYQEVFTDPSYSGQIVVMTAPQIGNYGINAEDPESTKPQITGVVV